MTSPYGHNYGIMYPHDVDYLEQSVALAVEQPSRPLRFLEVGVHEGYTSKGVTDWLRERDFPFEYYGVDLVAPKLEIPWTKFVQDDSFDAAQQFTDKFFDWIFIDGCHCFVHAATDFLIYKAKLKKGGILAFHDVNVYVEPGTTYYQGHGDITNQLRHVGVRQALISVGLLQGRWADTFELIEDAPGVETSGGVAVFRKIR